MSDQPAYRIAIANGGFLQHVLPKGAYTALCGYTPSSPRGFMFHRACWKDVRDMEDDRQTRPDERPCKKCWDEWEKLNN